METEKTDVTDTMPPAPLKKTDDSGNKSGVIDTIKRHCDCGGIGFDTCCEVKKNCCETKIDIQKSAYTLQKNFGDASPFAYDYFKLKGKKQNLCIRICNINRLAYDITAAGEVVKATLPDINIFDSLAKTYKDVPSAATPKTSQAENGVPIAERVGPEEPGEFKQIQEKKKAIAVTYESLASHLKALERFARFAQNVPVIIGGECCNQQRIKDRLSEQADINAYKPGITFDELAGTIAVEFPQHLTDAKEAAKTIIKLKEDIQKLVKEYKNTNCIADVKKIKGVPYQRQQLPKECGEIEKKAVPDNDDDITKALGIAAKADIDELAKSIAKINNLLAQVNSEKNFFYVQCFDKNIDAELITINFKAIPKDVYKTLLDSQKYVYTVPVTGRFKWAMGPALNFHFGGTLVNKSYSLDSIRNAAGTASKDTFSISENAQRSRVVPYVGFMAHFYWQTHNALTPGISIGISTSPTQLSDLRAYLGTAFIIGGPLKGKLILSTGLSGAAVDRLKPNLKIGDNLKNRLLFNGNNLPSPEQLVDKVFRIGFYFGISYNLRD